MRTDKQGPSRTRYLLYHEGEVVGVIPSDQIYWYLHPYRTSPRPADKENVFDQFTPESRHSLLFAQRRAAARYKNNIDVPDLLHGVLADGVWASTLLLSVGAYPDAVMAPLILRGAPRFYEPETPMDFTSEARRALGRSKKLADRYSHQAITSAHILVACLTVGDPEVDEIAKAHELSSARLAAELDVRFD